MTDNMKLSFFQLIENNGSEVVYAVQHTHAIESSDLEALGWLFGGAQLTNEEKLTGYYVGPRAEMITPWSTTAREITLNMGLGEKLGISRIEMFIGAKEDTPFDRMLLRMYQGLNGKIFELNGGKAEVLEVKDIRTYNQEEGLALSDEEIEYLERVAEELGRPLTDGELFGFSQVNSEHCRHKIFGGTFVIDGEEKKKSLFKMIKETSAANPNNLLSAYKDNVAFNRGPKVELFAPEKAEEPSLFATREVETALSLKAETHNFPTTVEPFNGAATGTGGEIRDRLAGGRASLPLAGTAVYMTPYNRLQEKPWEKAISARPWLYQTPQELLTKASNGASDFGNKFGQPLINGSLLTFEHQEGDQLWGYDKVIMLAGGIGYTTVDNALKEDTSTGDQMIVMGGDNYRIGMGGGAVSSVNTGHFADAVELNAIQRSNPEMQKRVANVIRAMAESEENPIISIHDHGAGGHLNCLSELVDQNGGVIHLDKLPIGDPTLSAKEVISNESQERMGLLVKGKDVPYLKEVAEREMAPFYEVGEATGDMELRFVEKDGSKPFDLKLEHLFGSAPKTIMEDKTQEQHFTNPDEGLFTPERIVEHIKNVQSLEAVGCKDWLTNKVDRSVSGRVARQQCQGEYQLPVSDFGAVALDYTGKAGVATSIGHAPQIALIDPAAASRVAIAEALTNIVGAPLAEGLKSISLSANWMWPCKNPGEDARLYQAVEACSQFAIALGINIPTGKDSLSMTQKYPDGSKVLSPGTLIVSASGELSDVSHLVGNILTPSSVGHTLLRVDFSNTEWALGGSALYQTVNKVGEIAPDIADSHYFLRAFNTIQMLIKEGLIHSIHDISAGGVITTILEMVYPQSSCGVAIQADEKQLYEELFAENPGVVIEVNDLDRVITLFHKAEVDAHKVAEVIGTREVTLNNQKLDLTGLFKSWTTPSDAMEPFQTKPAAAEARKRNRWAQPINWQKGANVKDGKLSQEHNSKGITAAIIRDKGTNGEREMAYALYLAGFDVKDVHMSDLISGRETLEDVRLIVFCGGFSHSDVLGSAKGWAAGFKYNNKAKEVLEKFYARPDTLSLGICNGCQLMAELELLYPEHELKHKMKHNDSGKFESGFVSLTVPANNSIFLSSLEGSTLGCWVAHGEGRFELPYSSDKYNVAVRYTYNEYPGNPNGSPEGIAALSSKDGRHLAMMPHPERSIFPWQCGYYPESLLGKDEVTPWFEMFTNAFDWLAANK